MAIRSGNTLFAGGILAAILLILWRMGRRQKVQTVLSVLKKDEKMVLECLIKRKGECKQRQIVRETDFSKAKVSRILMDLEKRGVIKKERRGRTNIVQLKKE